MFDLMGLGWTVIGLMSDSLANDFSVLYCVYFYMQQVEPSLNARCICNVLDAFGDKTHQFVCRAGNEKFAPQPQPPSASASRASA